MDGQLEALVALDDWYIALQRIRDVVAAAETYTPGAFRKKSVKPLWQDATEAQEKLLSALGTLERETAKARKQAEIEDESGCVVGWQETLTNGKRAARVSVVGETITVALREAESSQPQPQVQLCLSCQDIRRKMPSLQCRSTSVPGVRRQRCMDGIPLLILRFPVPGERQEWFVPEMLERPTARLRQVGRGKLEEHIGRSQCWTKSETEEEREDEEGSHLCTCQYS